MAEQNEKKDWHDLCEFPVHDFVTQDQNGSPLFFSFHRLTMQMAFFAKKDWDPEMLLPW